MLDACSKKSPSFKKWMDDIQDPKHPKITVTPHVAGLTSPYMALAYVENCVRKNEAGEPLADIVDIDRGY